MDPDQRKKLESLGYTPEILKALERTPEIEAVDRMFQERAEKALSEIGCSALEFLKANPSISAVALAKKLNRGANAIGLLRAACLEAAEHGAVRELAKDLLLRKILSRFPDGWTTNGDVRPTIEIGGWYSEIASHSSTAKFGKYAKDVMRCLVDDPPSNGWKPRYPQDSFVDGLFNKCWPLGE